MIFSQTEQVCLAMTDFHNSLSNFYKNDERRQDKVRQGENSFIGWYTNAARLKQTLHITSYV